MRGTVPTLHCDAEDGFCGVWDVDHYESSASSVNGTPVTAVERSPGWLSTETEDFCPAHNKNNDKSPPDIDNS